MKPIPPPMAQRARYKTSPLRVTLALLAGAATGGGAFASIWVLLSLPYALGGGADQGAGATLTTALALFAGIVAAFVYLVGLLLIGAPAWWFAHRRGYRDWWAAAGLGAVVNGGVMLALGAYGAAGVIGIVVFAAIGALVGAVIWRVAYVRVAPDYLGVW